MITREQAIELLHKNIQNQNLRRHCYAVEATMAALAKRLGHTDEADKWAISGLLHDADWEITQKEPDTHTRLVTDWIREIEFDKDIEDAILSHGWGYVKGNPEPVTPMQWALYCCDELTGLIVACALVKPEKKLSAVTVETILKKWDEKSFAAGVNRSQIKECEGRLQIPIQEFIQITLTAMQAIAGDLGL